MNKRRQFLKLGLGIPISVGFLYNPFVSMIKWVFAKTPGRDLIDSSGKKPSFNENPPPAISDGPGITDLKDFQTMGTTDHVVDLDNWRLEVSGLVKGPLNFTYPEILALPSIEKKVSLVCPGFFTNTGLWKGISMKELFGKAAVEEGFTHVVVTGPEGAYPKTEVFPIKDFYSNKVFLAYGVNGQRLPQRNGFPLRIVAEGYPGDDWVKYVYKIKLEKR